MYQQTLYSKFMFILIQTLMRFYAKKIVYFFDDTVKSHLSKKNFSILCEECNTLHFFKTYSSIHKSNYHSCHYCR